MTQTFISRFLPATLIVGLLFGAYGTLQAQTSASGEGSAKMSSEMHQHWHKLITENDPRKRQVLIQEHRNMIEAMTKLGSEEAASMKEHGGIMQHHDLKNMADMHAMMLDMIESSTGSK
ncbi:MAG TPA: hypothetical protein EYH06_10690 [Chromatiales bacterium]|nr:hypothetical protein [Thiotrichales bacterium]HIP69035.1 hypothetical protein [Chromatiales bacterium]